MNNSDSTIFKKNNFHFYALIFFSLVACIANLICFTVFQAKVYQKAISKLIKLNSIIDFLYLIFGLLSMLILYNNDSLTICIIFFARLLNDVSSFMSLTIAAQRCFYVCGYRSKSNRFIIILMVFFIFLSILLNVSLIAKDKFLHKLLINESNILFLSQELFLVQVNQTTVNVFYYVWNISLVLLMLIFKILILYRMRMYFGNLKSSHSQTSIQISRLHPLLNDFQIYKDSKYISAIESQIIKKSKSNRIEFKVTLMVLFISCAFILDHLHHLAHYKIKQNMKNLHPTYSFISQILVIFFHSFYIVVYCMFDTLFWKILRKKFCCNFYVKCHIHFKK